MASSDTWFKKGRSANPKGRRPKRDKETQTSAFSVIANKTLTANVNGKSRQMTVTEALQHQIFQKAIGGDRGAQKDILRMILVREKARARHASRKPPLVERLILRQPDDAVPALTILRIVCPDRDSSAAPGALLLELWAVKAALARRRGARLRKKEVEEIRQKTRDSQKVSWPDGDDDD